MLKKILKLALRNSDYSLSFIVLDFLFRKILKRNSGVKWPVHFTTTIHNPEKLRVGKNTYPGDSPGIYINAQMGINIGDNTNIGPNVVMVSANHDPILNSNFLPSEPIYIGADCWIGGNACILPGVRLGDRTIVGAGSVVTKSFPKGNCIIAGNPAKIIRIL